MYINQGTNHLNFISPQDGVAVFRSPTLLADVLTYTFFRPI